MYYWTMEPTQVALVVRWEPLQAAANAGRTAAVPLLIERGAKVNQVSGPHHTALSAALAGGYLEIVQLLHAGDDAAGIGGKHGSLVIQYVLTRSWLQPCRKPLIVLGHLEMSSGLQRRPRTQFRPQYDPIRPCLSPYGPYSCFGGRFIECWQPNYRLAHGRDDTTVL